MKRPKFVSKSITMKKHRPPTKRMLATVLREQDGLVKDEVYFKMSVETARRLIDKKFSWYFLFKPLTRETVTEWFEAYIRYRWISIKRPKGRQGSSDDPEFLISLVRPKWYSKDPTKRIVPNVKSINKQIEILKSTRKVSGFSEVIFKKYFKEKLTLVEISHWLKTQTVYPKATRQAISRIVSAEKQRRLDRKEQMRLQRIRDYELKLSKIA